MSNTNMRLVLQNFLLE